MKINKTKSLLILGTLLTGALGASWFALSDQQQKIGITLRDLQEGTQISYQIKSNNQVVERSHATVSQSGTVNLAAPKELVSSNQHKEIEYKINMQPPQSATDNSAAEALNLLVNLSKETGDIALEAKGIEEFSELNIKSGNTNKKLSADWTGQFSADSLRDALGQTDGNAEDVIELAFQNAGISSDVDSLQSGKMDIIFFGDGSGASDTTINRSFSASLAQMTTEIATVMSVQTFMIGKFFDARIQLTTQRKLQELQARAHKDYHPSEQMCRIGTFMRSVAATESKSEVDRIALNRMFMNQYLGVENSVAAGMASLKNPAKTDAFSRKYCDPKDAGGALEQVCEDADIGNEIDIARKNKDIDYARTLALPLTLDVNFTDPTATNDEEDIIALGKNLYFPNSFRFTDGSAINQGMGPHYDSRSFAAKMNVAHSSFVNIVGMKASAPEGQATTATDTTPPPGPLGTGSDREDGSGLITPLRTTRTAPVILAEDSGWAYMKAMMREFGITNDVEIDQLLGVRPSYYAQMEVLTKKIYQHPNFYTNLYDKPANVKRIGASLDAITVMNQRDRYESMIRQEMLSAVLLEEELKRSVEEVNAQIQESIALIAQGDR